MLYLNNTKGKDGRQLVTDIFEWDVVNWSSALDLWLPALKAMPPEAGSRAIEIGSRRGGLALLAAIEGHSVVCSDLDGPEEEARSLHLKYKVEERVTYASLDITLSVLPEQHVQAYQVVMFKSMLGGAGRDGRDDLQQRAINNMAAMLQPGGLLLFAENLAGSPLHRFFRKRFTHWGSYWNYPDPQRMKSMLREAGFSVELKYVGFLGAFGRNEKQRQFLGRIDRFFFNSVLPASWKYLMTGVAKKES